MGMVKSVHSQPPLLPPTPILVGCTWGNVEVAEDNDADDDDDEDDDDDDDEAENADEEKGAARAAMRSLRAGGGRSNIIPLPAPPLLPPPLPMLLPLP
jgi:hypothetical protein